jgi:NAD(P)-dependent dehydrogenase (short-subunit alcohol dehydrogenase family)
MSLNDLYNMGETVPVNFMTPISLCNLLLLLFKQDGGHIINIASVAGITGDPDAPIYSACKAGIINFTRSMAKIAAPKVRVNCISPGFFNTNLVEGDTPQELIGKVPMEREAEPIEIIPVVHMLQTSTYMTGANIVIDGGLSL